MSAVYALGYRPGDYGPPDELDPVDEAAQRIKRMKDDDLGELLVRWYRADPERHLPTIADYYGDEVEDERHAS